MPTQPRNKARMGMQLPRTQRKTKAAKRLAQFRKPADERTKTKAPGGSRRSSKGEVVPSVGNP